MSTATAAERNTLRTLLTTYPQVSAVLFVDASTGTYVHDNRIVCGSTALAGGCDVGNGGYAAENYVQNSADSSGILDPSVDS